MEQNRFFKFIWRANGLLIFITVLFTLGLMVFLTFETLIPTFQDTPPPQQTLSTEREISPNAQLKLEFERSSLQEKYVIVDLYSEQDEKGLKSYTRRKTRNVGIHNLITGKTNWIFPNNNQHVNKSIRIVKALDRVEDKSEKIAVGHFLVTATTSSNGDIVRDIWVSSVDGQNTQKLISDVSAEPELRFFDTNQARILIETDGALKTIEFDIDTRTIGKSTTINLPK